VDVGGWIHLDLEASDLFGDAGNTPGAGSTFLCMADLTLNSKFLFKKTESLFELTVSLSETIDDCRLANIRHATYHEPSSHSLELWVRFRLYK